MFSQVLENGGGCVRTAVPGTAAGVWAAAHRECGGLRKDSCHVLCTNRYMFLGKQIQILLLILGFHEMKSEQSGCLSGTKGSIIPSQMQSMLQKNEEGYISQEKEYFWMYLHGNEVCGAMSTPSSPVFMMVSYLCPCWHVFSCQWAAPIQHLSLNDWKDRI